MGQSLSFLRVSGSTRLAQSRLRMAAAALVATAAVCAGGLPADAESTPQWSAIASQAIVTQGVSPAAKWDIEAGFRAKALEAQWYNTARGGYFNYARSTVDAVLADPNWNAPGRSPYADALLGEHLMLLYRVTQKPVYYEAAKQLRQRLSTACGLDRRPERESHPCRAQQFLAEYAAEFQQPEDFGAITRSLASWDASAGGAATDANADAGDRLLSLVWMASSLTDSVSSFPTNDPARDQALAAPRLAAATLARHQDRTPASCTLRAQRPAARPRPPWTGSLSMRS